MVRLNLQDRISIDLDEEEYLYAPAQGALGVKCRSDDLQLIKILSCLNDKESYQRCTAERQFLNKLEGV